MKLSRFTWRMLLAISISTGMAWNALGHADEGSDPRPVCPPVENQGIETITVFHTQGQQSVTLGRSQCADETSEPAGAEPAEAFPEAELDSGCQGYKDDGNAVAIEENFTAEPNYGESNRDQNGPGENIRAAVDPWEEYAYDEYGYDEYSINDEVVVGSDAGEQAVAANDVEASDGEASDVREPEFNIWGEPIYREVVKAQSGPPEEPLEDPSAAETVAVVGCDADWGADQWDCWYEFEEPVVEASPPAEAGSNVEVGNSVRHLKMQALQMVARSFDHAGRTLQVVSADLMRISGKSVAQRPASQRN